MSELKAGKPQTRGKQRDMLKANHLYPSSACFLRNQKVLAVELQ
jgi:hypothetical protein